MTKYCCHVAGAKLQMTLARDYQANPLFGDYRIQILSEIKLYQCGMQSRESVEGKIKSKPIRVQAKAIGWPELTDHVYVCVCVCSSVHSKDQFSWLSSIFTADLIPIRVLCLWPKGDELKPSQDSN